MRDADEPFDGDLHLLSREELEATVRRRTAELENILNTMVDLLVVVDPNGDIRLVNDSVSSLLGYDETDILGKPIDVLLASSDSNEELSDMLTEAELVERLLAAGEVIDVEVSFSTRDGETVPMSVSASTMETDGELSGIVYVAKDISERKAAEDRAAFLHSLLRHDLRNKLQITEGYLELIETEELSADNREYLDHARDGLEDASELLETVRMLQQAETEEPTPVSLQPMLQEACDGYETVSRDHDIELVNEVAMSVTVLASDILGQVFSNLIENAIDHANAEQIRLSLTKQDNTATVTIEDDGRGIPDDVKSKIFEKGFKGDESDGSGLGLYLSKRLVETYGGEIRVGDSDLGGAKFEVTLQTASVS